MSLDAETIKKLRELRRIPSDFIGRTFGLLTVEKFIERRAYRNRWLCSCSCGGSKDCGEHDLKRGIVRSCGCLQKGGAARERHGKSNSKEYNIWSHMRRRCHDPDNASFESYGGAGIFVCDEWRDSFISFLNDMGPIPDWASSIDRIDNDKGYEPGNCRWADSLMQARNKRNTLTVEIMGLAVPLVEAADTYGLKYGTLRAMVRRGIPAEIAFEKLAGFSPRNTLEKIDG